MIPSTVFLVNVSYHATSSRQGLTLSRVPLCPRKHSRPAFLNGPTLLSSSELVPPGTSPAQAAGPLAVRSPRGHAGSSPLTYLCASFLWACWICSSKTPPGRESEQRVTHGPQNRNKRRNGSKSPRSRKTQIHQKRSLPLMTTASRISRLSLVRPGPVPCQDRPATSGGRLEGEGSVAQAQARRCPGRGADQELAERQRQMAVAGRKPTAHQPALAPLQRLSRVASVSSGSILPHSSLCPRTCFHTDIRVHAHTHANELCGKHT